MFVKQRLLMILLLIYFWARNFCDRKTVTGKAPVTVSLTTYGRRLHNVHLVVESIAAGRIKPREIVLWLDEPDLARVPAPLLRLERRGLRLAAADATLGPHKKYLPSCLEISDLALVTADDDVFYPRSWLQDLMLKAEKYPTSICAYRARLLRLSVDSNSLLPYASWSHVSVDTPSLAHLAIGVDGVLYPPSMRSALAGRPEGARLVPRADDLWINSVALETRTPTTQVFAESSLFLSLPYSQHEALSGENLEGGNDRAATLAYRRINLTEVPELRSTAPSSED